MDGQKILEEKIEAAKKDLEDWKSFSDTIGQAKPDDPDYELCFSCTLMRVSEKDDIDCCKSTKYGKCVFYGCLDRPSYKEWLKHHKQFHPKDDRLYVACDECNNIRNKEVALNEKAIHDLEKELNKPKHIPPTKKQLEDIGKIYANLSEEAAKRYTVKDNESRYYERYCNPVKDDLVKHLNFMTNLYTKSSQSLAYEAEKWDQLAQIVQETEDEATTEDRNPMVTEIIDHLSHMANICRARSIKILDMAERERIEGSDLVCLKK